MKTLYNSLLILAMLFIGFRIEALNETNDILQTSFFMIPVVALFFLQDKFID